MTTLMPSDERLPSTRPELLRQHQDLARALHLGPAAVELVDQRLQGVAAHGAVERGLIGELIHGLVERGIVDAPEPPGLVDAERFRRIRQMLPAVPFIEGFAL